MNIKSIALSCAVLLLAGAVAFAQQQEPQTPEQREKQLYESIQKQVDGYAESLDLEDWQVFYVDSTLQHDYAAMMEEIQDMQKSKVDNVDLYRNVQDKWMEQIEKSYRKYFTDDQWSLYLRSGAAKAQRAREKRREKAAKARVSGKK